MLASETFILWRRFVGVAVSETFILWRWFVGVAVTNILPAQQNKGCRFRDSPIFCLSSLMKNYSAVRPERSIPSTRYLWPNRYRMISGAIIHKPQVFLIAA